MSGIILRGQKTQSKNVLHFDFYTSTVCTCSDILFLRNKIDLVVYYVMYFDYRKIPKYLDTWKIANGNSIVLLWSSGSNRCRQNGKSLIWVYTVCLDLSVRKLKIITVNLQEWISRQETIKSIVFVFLNFLETTDWDIIYGTDVKSSNSASKEAFWLTFLRWG